MGHLTILVLMLDALIADLFFIDFMELKLVMESLI